MRGAEFESRTGTCPGALCVGTDPNALLVRRLRGSSIARGRGQQASHKRGARSEPAVASLSGTGSRAGHATAAVSALSRRTPRCRVALGLRGALAIHMLCALRTIRIEPHGTPATVVSGGAMNPDPFRYGIIGPYAGMGIGFPNSGPSRAAPSIKNAPAHGPPMPLAGGPRSQAP